MVGRNQRELLVALERARTRLAVAIATEAKSTPPERWRYYFETTERTRRFLKRLRNGDSEMFCTRQRWTEALDSLKQLSPHAETAHLCRLLSEILTKVNPDSDLP
jgi:hypothetical protein